MQQFRMIKREKIRNLETILSCYRQDRSLSIKKKQNWWEKKNLYFWPVSWRVSWCAFMQLRNQNSGWCSALDCALRASRSWVQIHWLCGLCMSSQCHACWHDCQSLRSVMYPQCIIYNSWNQNSFKLWKWSGGWSKLIFLKV